MTKYNKPTISRRHFAATAAAFGLTAPSMLRAQIATWNPQRGLGTANRGRYSNPTVDGLIDQAMATMDDGARDKLIQQAMRTALADVPVIHLHLQKNIWATRKGLTYEARVDEQTEAMGVMPAK